MKNWLDAPQKTALKPYALFLASLERRAESFF